MKRPRAIHIEFAIIGVIVIGGLVLSIVNAVKTLIG
jgi:hypothetical protein